MKVFKLGRKNIIERMNSFFKTAANGCWEWQGHINKGGYGVIANRSEGPNKKYLVHRLMWSIRKGDIPPGYSIDHLCRNKKCANPDHLEPVLPAENTRRGNSPSTINRKKTHCYKGHLLAGDNLGIRKTKNGTGRKCLICHREYMKIYMRNKT